MTSLYDERRKKLKLENHTAKKLLLSNIENFKFSDIISLGGAGLPASVKGVVDNPDKLIKGGDLLSRTVLPRGNFIRKIFRTLSFLKRTLNLLTSK